jgi:hypothetical protein
MQIIGQECLPNIEENQKKWPTDFRMTPWSFG